MITFPNAKINLGLQITGKRKDGYHDLISFFYPVSWCDMLEIIPSNSFTFAQTGVHIPGKEQDNLCVKAFHLLKKDFKISNVSIHLHKLIPIGAGLGGGSSDGAFTLKMLDQIFQLNLSISLLESYAKMLGSDCAFFIDNRPKICIGTGDDCMPFPLDLSTCFAVILYPNIPLSTADAYQKVIAKKPERDLKEILTDQKSWALNLKNDFEEGVFSMHPELIDIKQSFYDSGAFFASLSGSGSCIYGLFDHYPDNFYSNYPHKIMGLK